VIVLLVPVEQDTTEYLLSTKANRDHLHEALRNVETRQNLVVVTPSVLLTNLQIGQLRIKRFTLKSSH
jgi:hypothetical protein